MQAADPLLVMFRRSTSASTLRVEAEHSRNDEMLPETSKDGKQAMAERHHAEKQCKPTTAIRQPAALLNAPWFQ